MWDNVLTLTLENWSLFTLSFHLFEALSYFQTKLIRKTKPILPLVNIKISFNFGELILQFQMPNKEHDIMVQIIC